jgi:cell division protein FtsQ
VGVVLLVTGIVMSPLLTLSQIIVKGRTDVPEKVIVGAAADQVGQPLVALNFDAIRERLGSVTRIQSYTTEIQPPNTLVIRVVERRAIGFMAQKSKWVVVDAAGVVIDTVTEKPTGVPEMFVESTTDRAFSAMAETLVSLPRNIRSKVASMSAQTRDSVRFTLRGTGHEIVWGSPDNSALKVLVMKRALRVANQSFGVFEIDVSAPDNIVLQPLR